MLKLFWILLIIAILLDTVLIWELRTLVYSFLLSKHNVRGAKKIHQSQSLKDKFLLGYIKEHAIFTKRYVLWHRLYLSFLLSIPLQYIAIILTGIFYIAASVNLMVVVEIIKSVLALIVRSQFITQSHNITIFDKRSREKRFRK